MDVHSGKTAINGLVVPRRGLRDTADSRDENVHPCSRLGCSGRLNHSKSSCVGTTEKSRSFRPAFNASNGKDVVGSSSRTSSVPSVGKARETSNMKSFSQVGNDQLGISSLDGVPEVTEQIQSSPEYQLKINSAVRGTGSSKARSTEAGYSSGTSSSRPRKIVCHKSCSYNQNTLMHASASSQSTGLGSEKQPCSSGAGYGLRNLNCKSISDVLPHNCSKSESRFSRTDMVKRRNTEGESSSSVKGKKIAKASLREKHVSRPTCGVSISESRSGRNLDFSVNNHAASVQTHRPMNVNCRFRGPVQDSLQTESSSLVQSLHRPETPDLNLQLSSQLFTDGSSSHSSDYSFPGNDIDDLPSVVPFTSAELGINRLMNQQALQRYNMDGVAQVLLALERIEQDDELTYELLALETNLLLSGLNFYDQHRDLRLDIDSMSYEELLALEDRMGTVSTALSEEAVSKSLQRSIYQSMPLELGAFGGDGDEDEDEIKCSICQEEYVVGDEIGKLECKHDYHVECVQQWLKLKNWCPICKASAASSKLTTAPS